MSHDNASTVTEYDMECGADDAFGEFDVEPVTQPIPVETVAQLFAAKVAEYGVVA